MCENREAADIRCNYIRKDNENDEYGDFTVTIVAIVQARLGSTRLPNKILKKLNGTTILGLFIERLKHSKMLNRIVIATTDNERDQVVAEYAKELGVGCYRGSEEDVLDRTYKAAKEFGADIIVRVTSDCPLNDPFLIDKMIKHFLDSNLDYLCNRKPPTFPDGFDIEIFNFKSLEIAWKEAEFKFEREHVTPYISERKNIFKVGNYSYGKDYSSIRLTVDYEEDFKLVKRIYDALYKKGSIFTLEDILEFIEKNPKLVDLNSKYVRDEKYHKERKEELQKNKKENGF